MKYELLSEDHQSYAVNPIIAHGLFYVKYIEEFGNCTVDIFNICRVTGLQQPVFDIDAQHVMVTVYRPILDEQGNRIPITSAEVKAKNTEVGVETSEVGSKASEVGVETPEVARKPEEVKAKPEEVKAKNTEVGLKALEVGQKATKVGLKPDKEYMSRGIQCYGLSFWQKSSENRTKGIECRLFLCYITKDFCKVIFFLGETMIVSYKKLWYQLIDKKLKKADLKRMTGISPSTLANLTKDKNVSLEVLLKICDALHCNLCDIVESLPDPEPVSEQK